MRRGRLRMKRGVAKLHAGRLWTLHPTRVDVCKMVAIAPDDVTLGASTVGCKRARALSVQHQEIVVIHAEPNVVVDIDGDLIIEEVDVFHIVEPTACGRHVSP